MKANLYTNIPSFKGYQNSKYMDSYTTNSLLDSSAKEEYDPADNLDTRDTRTIYDYSKGRIENLYSYFGVYTEDKSKKINEKTAENFEKRVNTIISRLSKGGVDSSNLEMLLDLVNDKQLTPEILIDMYRGGKISANVSSDLDKLYEAYADRKNPEDVFVPKFKDEKSAKEGIQTGDVCQIEGEDNISIKMADGSIKKLFISEKTYLELFPPVERFIINQSNVGDCYLLSAFDSINQNPNTRFKILEMFKENPDGTVDIVFGGFKNKDGEIVPNNPDNFVLKDIESKIKEYSGLDVSSRTIEGIRAVEILNETIRRQKADEGTKAMYEKFKELRQSLDDGNYIALDKEDIFWFGKDEETINKMVEELRKNDSVFTVMGFVITPDWQTKTNEQTFTRDELNYFMSFYEAGEEMFNSRFANVSFEISRKTISELLSELEDEDYDSSKYEALVLKRWLKNMDKEGSDTADIKNEILPVDILIDIFDKEREDFIYNHYGCVSDILGLMGFDVDISVQKDEEKCLINSDTAHAALFASDVSSRVFTANAQKDNLDFDFPIYAKHGYSIQPVDTKDGRRFLVRNPHNTMFEMVCTYEELCKHFNEITSGKLKDSAN